VVAVSTGEGAALVSDLSADVGSASHCGGWHESLGHSSGLCSLNRIGLCQPLWWRERQVMALIWHLFYRSAWAQPHTFLTGTTFRALQWTLISCSAWPQTATFRRARNLKALLWPLIYWWAWDQPGTFVVDTTAEGAVPASVRSVDVGSESHYSYGKDCIGHCSGLFSLRLRGVSQPLWWRLDR
jgi:hypothetical protein